MDGGSKGGKRKEVPRGVIPKKKKGSGGTPCLPGRSSATSKEWRKVVGEPGNSLPV